MFLRNEPSSTQMIAAKMTQDSQEVTTEAIALDPIAKQALAKMQTLGYCKGDKTHETFCAKSISKATRLWLNEFKLSDAEISKEQFLKVAWGELKESQSYYLRGLKESNLNQLFDLYMLNQNKKTMNLTQFCHAFLYFDRPAVMGEEDEISFGQAIELLSSIPREQFGKEPLFSSREKTEEQLKQNNNKFRLRIGEGRNELYKNIHLSYGLNLIISVYHSESNTIKHMPLISAIQPIFLDHEKKNHTNLNFLEATAAALIEQIKQDDLHPPIHRRKLRRVRQNPVKEKLEALGLRYPQDEKAADLWEGRFNRETTLSKDQFKSLVLNESKTINSKYLLGLKDSHLETIFDLCLSKISSPANVMDMTAFCRAYELIHDPICAYQLICPSNLAAILDLAAKNGALKQQAEAKIDDKQKALAIH